MEETLKVRLRIEPLLVALITLVPMAAAYWLYYSGRGADLPLLVNEERQIMTPPIALPPLAGTDGEGRAIDNLWSAPEWSLVYVRTGPCTDVCRDELVRLLQVYLSLGKDQDRVRRVFLGPGEGPGAEDPALLAGRLDGPEGQRLLELLRGAGQPVPPNSARLYVVDPHGNLVLGYPAEADQRALRDDLERLLKVSRIG
jgi:cytochrome oxidase Cu insertion factor (SCO1/SenC/PrrC family)